jgi:hypothetical protein
MTPLRGESCAKLFLQRTNFLTKYAWFELIILNPLDPHAVYQKISIRQHSLASFSKTLYITNHKQTTGIAPDGAAVTGQKV